MKTFIVVTTISAPNEALRQIADGCKTHGQSLIVIGDKKSPDDFSLDGAIYYDLDSQQRLSFAYARKCPIGHYCRKNIGYLLALESGATVIVETDDDNVPESEFWLPRSKYVTGFTINGERWINVYKYFSQAQHCIWPRGFPLLRIRGNPPSLPVGAGKRLFSPIQQALANDDPDVDAIYRITGMLPTTFKNRPPVLLAEGSYCPINSQNTTWFFEAFPLLYLPATCSFRMTDIWRGLVAQRLSGICGWHTSFHQPTVRQYRNDHNLIADLADELPGYMYNENIVEALEQLDLVPGSQHLTANLLTTYEMLVNNKWLHHDEIALVKDWVSDINRLLKIPTL